MIDLKVYYNILDDVDSFKKELNHKYGIDLAIGVNIKAKRNFKAVISKAASYFETTDAILLGTDKKGVNAKARKFLIYYLRTEYNLGPKYLGKLLRKNHSTIIYHHQKMVDELDVYSGLDKEYRDFKVYLNKN